MTREFRLENQMTSSNIFAAVYVQIPKVLGPVSVNYGTGQTKAVLTTNRTDHIPYARHYNPLLIRNRSHI